VVLGLLDARGIAGNVELVTTLRAGVLSDWRAHATSRLGELRSMVRERRARSGDLSQLLEPDLKLSYGGLRDVVVLRALAASWVVDVPHTGWEESAQFLLDVRDALHQATPRDRLLMQEHDGIAARLDLRDADDLLRQVYLAARDIAYASDVTWYRADRATSKPSRFAIRSRTPARERAPLAEGVVVQGGEALLAREAQPARDPGLTLRLCAAAAQAGLPVAPHALERLATESAPMPAVWPREVRESWVSLLGAGASAVPILEALDHVGILSELIPGWEQVRSAPQRNPIHQFTVDRHLIETAAAASGMTRLVSRPDLLLVAAFLHDIGKGRGGDHSLVGADMAATLVPMMGFSQSDTDIVVDLVRHHLLLADTATRRDLEDPATVRLVTSAIGDHDALDLLHALTRADSMATGPAVQSEWRDRLIGELVSRAHMSLAGPILVAEPENSPRQERALREEGIVVSSEVHEDGLVITVGAPDRIGLLAHVAGVLSIHRLQIRGARLRTVGDRAVQEWFVRPLFGTAPDPSVMAGDISRALDGTLDVAARLAAREMPPRRGDVPRPVVLVHEDADRHTILEVRAHDEPGLLHQVASAISASGATVHGAKVDTLGSEVIDSFFLTDRSGTPLSSDHARAVRTTVEAALSV
jgi:[protein-PII] uridylyltransferase